jgi:hypothetical protein
MASAPSMVDRRPSPYCRGSRGSVSALRGMVAWPGDGLRHASPEGAMECRIWNLAFGMEWIREYHSNCTR